MTKRDTLLLRFRSQKGSAAMGGACPLGSSSLGPCCLCSRAFAQRTLPEARSWAQEEEDELCHLAMLQTTWVAFGKCLTLPEPSVP